MLHLMRGETQRVRQQKWRIHDGALSLLRRLSPYAVALVTGLQAELTV